MTLRRSSLDAHTLTASGICGGGSRFILTTKRDVRSPVLCTCYEEMGSSGRHCQSSPKPTHLLHSLKIALSALGSVEMCGNQEGFTPKGTLNALGKKKGVVIWMMDLTWNSKDRHVEKGNTPVSFK